jgi:hypothetical protein
MVTIHKNLCDVPGRSSVEASHSDFIMNVVMLGEFRSTSQFISSVALFLLIGASPFLAGASRVHIHLRGSRSQRRESGTKMGMTIGIFLEESFLLTDEPRG